MGDKMDLFENGFSGHRDGIYAVHMTDLDNFLNIIKGGRIYARNKMKQVTDSANQDVISKASTDLKDKVRLYYATHTPTYFMWDGIKPTWFKGEVIQDPHIIHPVLFCFSKSLLTDSKASFTDGNATSSSTTVVSSFSEAVEQFDWENILGRGPIYDSDEKTDVIRKRNAEILYDGSLSLSKKHLVRILFRTKADQELAEILAKEKGLTERLDAFRGYIQVRPDYFDSAEAHKNYISMNQGTNYLEQAVYQNHKLELEFAVADGLSQYEHRIEVEYAAQSGDKEVSRPDSGNTYNLLPVMTYRFYPKDSDKKVSVLIPRFADRNKKEISYYMNGYLMGRWHV